MPLAAVSWLALASGSAAGLGGPTGGTSVFAPLSTHAEEIHRYSLFVLGITGAILPVVFTMLAVAVVRFRRRPGRSVPDLAARRPQGRAARAVSTAAARGPLRGQRHRLGGHRPPAMILCPYAALAC